MCVVVKVFVMKRGLIAQDVRTNNRLFLECFVDRQMKADELSRWYDSRKFSMQWSASTKK